MPDVTKNTFCLAISEDDDLIREQLCRNCETILESAGIPHSITNFSSAEELCEVLEKEPHRFHLLILDISMRGGCYVGNGIGEKTSV